MVCGVHGPVGRLAVKRVVAVVPERENGTAIIRNQPTMVHTVWVLDL